MSHKLYSVPRGLLGWADITMCDGKHLRFGRVSFGVHCREMMERNTTADFVGITIPGSRRDVGTTQFWWKGAQRVRAGDPTAVSIKRFCGTVTWIIWPSQGSVHNIYAGPPLYEF